MMTAEERIRQYNDDEDTSERLMGCMFVVVVRMLEDHAREAAEAERVGEEVGDG